MLQFIIIFTLCSLVNVMLNTAKTIIMYRNEKLSSALANAVTYGFYTVVVVLMAGDMELWVKVAVTAITNFIGVWLSMFILEKIRKDKLWRVEFTVNNERTDCVGIVSDLRAADVPFNANDLGVHTVFTCYCATQADSLNVKEIITKYGGKYFAVEGKSL